jgi:hypothetical protein
LGWQSLWSAFHHKLPLSRDCVARV